MPQTSLKTQQITISTANNRFSKQWQPKTLTWNQLTERLADITITGETQTEYANMTREQQGRIKDIGGFVGGELAGRLRRKNQVKNRHLITLDLDQATPDAPKNIKTALGKWSHVVYSTHSHTPQSPRLRIVLPLAYPIDPSMYEPLARWIASLVGIEQVDPTTYEPHRLMYWPSTSKDAESYYDQHDADLLDPDELPARIDPANPDTWPLAENETRRISDFTGTLEDPAEKPGLIGAYCRAWPMHKLLEGPLAQYYRPTTDPNRWTYIKGTTIGGLVIYDDSLAFSHHATDPAATGHDHNAFDLARIHLYGHLDSLDDLTKPVTEHGSHKAMLRHAAQDSETRIEATKARLEEIRQDFDPLEPEELHKPNWAAKLVLNKNGTPRDTIPNQRLILENTPEFDSIAYDLHAGMITVSDPESLPWRQVKPGWTKTDTALLQDWLQTHWDIYAPARTEAALLAVAASRAFHPIRQYLDQLPQWDKVPRLETLLIDYLGAPDTEYTRQATRLTIQAMIGRIKHPGIKFDHVLILNGPQGIGKSTLFQKLGGRWFSDALSIEDMRTKTGPEKLQGYWLLELSELAGMRKMDVETIKSFITTTDDKYRPAYGTCVESHPRQCVIVGSTNSETGFLRDTTGNRRFWPITVTGGTVKKPWDLTEKEIDQIFAEAKHGYAKGPALYLTGQAATQAAQAQTQAMEQDEREGLVRKYLDAWLPEDWLSMGLHERRAYLDGDADPLMPRPAGDRRRRIVSNVEIWAECFGQDPAKMAKRDAHEIGTIMTSLDGWEQKGKRHPLPLYGRQRVYERLGAAGEEWFCDELPF